MANSDTPFGFKLIGHASGSAFNARIRKYYTAATRNVGVGDLVQHGGTGSGLYPAVEQAEVADTNLVGVVVGIELDPTDLNRVMLPAATTGYVHVCDDPDAEYEIQEDGDTTALALTDINQNCEIVGLTVNTTTGRSIMELDSDSKTTTAQIRLMGPINREDNEIGAYCKWRVRINEGYMNKLAGS